MKAPLTVEVSSSWGYRAGDVGLDVFARGVSASLLAAGFSSGASVEALAAEHGIAPADVEAAIRWQALSYHERQATVAIEATK